MNKERILSYNMSKALSVEELREISAAGWTASVSGSGGWDPHTGAHGQVDGRVDG
jgi:hypothetical protein